MLGIECDGAAYHGSRSARDRDRLRQEVLEDHGWIIHRIWGTDWFQRPQEQLRRTVEAIEAARARLAAGPPAAAPPVEAALIEIIVVDQSAEEPDMETVALSVPYRQASVAVPTDREPHEVEVPVMAAIVRRIVEVEGPIHAAEIVARVRTLWGLQRAGNRIQAAVARGLAYAARQGGIDTEDHCAIMAGAAIAVRDRSAADSASLRKPDLLPPQEIREAVRRVIAANFGGSIEHVTIEVARLFGFKSTSAQLRSVVEAQIDRLVRDGTLDSRDGMLSLGTVAAEA